MDSTKPPISVIVPVLNEAKKLPLLLGRLRGMHALREVIVVDGGSVDDTCDITLQYGARLVKAGQASRPVQQNLGAANAKGEVLWFVHADTLPPKGADRGLLAALDAGSGFGCFRFRFDSDRPWMKFNSFCTRFPFMIFRGGDQTLFIKKGLFDDVGGFRARYVVMEEYDLIRRVRRLARFSIVPKEVGVSARKYLHNGYLKVNLANFIMFVLFYLGVAPAKLSVLYRCMIHHPMDVQRHEAETTRKSG